MLKATFRQIEIFLAVVEEGSFDAAAARLNISQAGVSRQIAAMEAGLGAPVFQRRRGARPALSVQGAAILDEASALMQGALAVSRKSAQATADAGVRKVLVAAGDHLMQDVFQPRMIDLLMDRPDIEVELVERPPQLHSVRNMENAGLDLAYFTFGPGDSIGAGRVISEVETGLYISPDHPLAKTWRLDSPHSLPLIMPFEGAVHERVLLSVLVAGGVANYHPVQRVQRAASMVNMAARGVGACSIMGDGAQAAVAAGRLVQLPVSLPALKRVVFRRPSSAGDEAVSAVERFLNGLAAESDPPVALVSPGLKAEPVVALK